VTASTIAIDTNILVYALSEDEPAKSAIAESLLAGLPPDRTVLLWQVACELNAVLVRMLERHRGRPEALGLAALLRTRFRVVVPTPGVLDAGLRIRRDHQVSYWDAMLIAACVEAGVTRLYTEDRQSAGTIEGVEILSPFA
jgi:predicted nucleic acid-binding protein